MDESSFLLVIVLCIFCVDCASKSIDTENQSSPTRTRNVVNQHVDTVDNEERKKCGELPVIILAELLGEAYNSRYMSVNRPLNEDEGRSDYSNAYPLSKRKADNLPSFYVEEKHSIELSEKPAWDIRAHIGDFEPQLSKKRRRKRAISIMNDQQALQPENASNMENKQNDGMEEDESESLATRDKRATGRNGAFSSAGQHKNDNNKKLYPWKCEAIIKWVDLGPDYFPRFLRTVECTKHYCWYKAFVCKPKSFAMKVLHRRKGLCADAANLRKISSFEFRSEFGEVWKWEEVAVNFCCDCTVA